MHAEIHLYLDPPAVLLKLDRGCGYTRTRQNSISLSISRHFERRENLRGSVARAQSFYLHANPRKTHFEATANISVGLRCYQNDRALATLARIFPRRLK